jgi:2-succinyl-5-enolpyruvyl-6-hydroxy-3-cyclohexene-1-carboxylate synthase
MDEKMFFENYFKANEYVKEKNEYFNWCKKQLSVLRNHIPELPFSNIWIASKLANAIPKNSVVHLGILNSLRAWNFFEFPRCVESSSNVGGFGIDGAVSTLIGASLVNNDKLYYLVVGDLAFFYDMNSLGNRHIKNNVRILLINNGKGTEFRNAGHNAAVFADDADKYIAAANHFGNKSSELVKNYVQSLGFLYLSASNKEDFLKVCSVFLDEKIEDRPMVFEVFTDNQDESDALQEIMNLM